MRENFKKIIAMLTVFALILTSRIPVPTDASVAALPFTDLTANWYRDSVQYVYEKGIMTGTTKTTFAPDMEITRAMVVTVLYRLSNEPAIKNKNQVFPDVPLGKWYSNAVAWAKENGIVGGYSSGPNKGKFGTNDKILRQDFAKILKGYNDYVGGNIPAETTTSYTVKSDAKTVSGYATESIEWAFQRLIIGNGSNIKPKDNLTRAEAATMIMRYDMKLTESRRVYLGVNLKASGGSYYKQYNSSPFYLGGVAYTKGFTLGEDGWYGENITFNLEGKYDKISGIAGNIDDISFNRSYTFIGDDEILGTIKIKAGELPIPFEFDVTGVHSLEIKNSTNGYSNNGVTNGFANVCVYKTGEDKPDSYISPTLPKTAFLGRDIYSYTASSKYCARYYPYSSLKENNVFSMGGVDYTNGFVMETTSAGCFANFNLDGHYKKIAGVAGNLDGETKDAKFNVYGDGELIGTIETKFQDLPKYFEFDITGVKMLRIESDVDSTNESGSTGFGYVKVYNNKSEKPSSYRHPEDLPAKGYLGYKIPAYSARHYIASKGNNSFTMGGEDYVTGFRLYAENYESSGYAVFNLDEKYTSFTGTFGNTNNSPEVTVVCKVYGDGKLLKTFSWQAGDTPSDFNIDITGVKQLLFKDVSSVNHRNGYEIAFGNAQVK
ncbi:MAG: S-layer homology domain-containing protein [Lachnospiraceae bacterium]|nr:S-layer homology domain-containing protein [Lachnospiraceae bacterium]